MTDAKPDSYYIGLIERLEEDRDLSDDEFADLIDCDASAVSDHLAARARSVREAFYGKDVYLRGLIEFTDYCRNNCYYCGIRCENKNAERYRLSREDILECADTGYVLGFRTFVLQGGEDPFFTRDRIVSIVREIKQRYPDTAVTLSIG